MYLLLLALLLLYDRLIRADLSLDFGFSRYERIAFRLEFRRVRLYRRQLLHGCKYRLVGLLYLLLSRKYLVDKLEILLLKLRALLFRALKIVHILVIVLDESFELVLLF